MDFGRGIKAESSSQKREDLGKYGSETNSDNKKNTEAISPDKKNSHNSTKNQSISGSVFHLNTMSEKDNLCNTFCFFLAILIYE